MANELSFGNIGRTLVTQFPELRDFIRKKFGSYYDLNSELPEAYPLFEDVLQGFLFALLDSDTDSVLRRRIFSFLDDMAASRDKEVVNLLWIAILEPLVSRRERVERAWMHLGDGAKKLAGEIALSRGLSENLPPTASGPRNGN